MALTEKGIQSLREAVIADTKKGDDCFNPDGCNVQRTMQVELSADDWQRTRYGITHACVQTSKCTHDYCGKYRWVMDRARQYAEFTGKTVEEVVAGWEEQRNYWYMNFYQECNQPKIKIGEGGKIVLYENWVASLEERFGADKSDWKFICPRCGNIQSGKDFIALGIEDWNGKVHFNCIGRYSQGKGCDWSLGGFLKIHKIVVVKDLQIFPVFETADE